MSLAPSTARSSTSSTSMGCCNVSFSDRCDLRAGLKCCVSVPPPWWSLYPRVSPMVKLKWSFFCVIRTLRLPSSSRTKSSSLTSPHSLLKGGMKGEEAERYGVMVRIPGIHHTKPVRV